MVLLTAGKGHSSSSLHLNKTLLSPFTRADNINAVPGAGLAGQMQSKVRVAATGFQFSSDVSCRNTFPPATLKDQRIDFTAGWSSALLIWTRQKSSHNKTAVCFALNMVCNAVTTLHLQPGFLSMSTAPMQHYWAYRSQAQLDCIFPLLTLVCSSHFALTSHLLAAGGVLLWLLGVAHHPVAGFGSLVVTGEALGKHGLLALAAAVQLLHWQGLRESEHEERREEEQGTTEQEAAPPGSDPAGVIGGDVQLTCGKGKSLTGTKINIVL